MTSCAHVASAEWDSQCAGKEDSSNELMDPSYYGIPADTGKRNQRKSRRKKS